MSFQNPKALTSDGRTFRKWSRKNLALLRKYYAKWPSATLARMLEKSVKSVGTKACRIGLRKSAARLKKMGSENVAKRKRWPKRYRANVR